MKWICTSSLILTMQAISLAQSDSLNIEDVYQGAAADENAIEDGDRTSINVNNPKHLKKLPLCYQAAISKYTKDNGCIAHLHELYRITDMTSNQWDSIMPLLYCEPCRQKPKFIHQSLILTAKDVSFTTKTGPVASKYNIRYRARSENGFHWGIHHFTQNNLFPANMTTGFFQMKKKKQHWIVGDFLPQTPQHLLFGNNLMSSSPWMVLPMVANAQRFLPYTSSIPNRHWRGMAYAFSVKKLTLCAAMDLDSVLHNNILKVQQQWGSVEWRNEKIKLQYHYHISPAVQKQKQGLNLTIQVKKQVIQTEWAGEKKDWMWTTYWIRTMLKNQMLRLEHRIEWKDKSLEQTIGYVHQILWNKQVKLLLATDHLTSYDQWLSNREKEQNLRLQITFCPQRHHAFYLRYQMRQKEQIMHQWRIDGQWISSENGKFHCRLEQHVQSKLSGWLSAFEYDWKPLGGCWHLIARQTFYAIPDWDLRIYMMDRELKGGMSIPAYNGRGKKSFFILQYQKPKIRMAFKWTKMNLLSHDANLKPSTLDLQLDISF